VRVRTVALPVEHGAWGFWLEPAALGLLLAPSAAGVALVVAALAALLLQNPLSLALADARRGRRYPRTSLAWRWAAGYAAALAAALGLALALAGTAAVLVPALLAAPLAALQLVYDARNRGRAFVAEAAGAVAIGALVASVALAGGWRLGPALLLWVLLAARSVPSIFYVRARLRLERGQAVATGPAWYAHGSVVLAVALAAAAGLLPWLVIVPYLLLAARAAVGLSPRRTPVSAKVIGFRELGFGIATVVLLALAFLWGR
jgi:hypothetical protein